MTYGINEVDINLNTEPWQAEMISKIVREIPEKNNDYHYRTLTFSTLYETPLNPTYVKIEMRGVNIPLARRVFDIMEGKK